MNNEILRMVDVIHKEKAIDKEVIFASIEEAIAIAAKKHLDTEEAPIVNIDRKTGNITASIGNKQIDTITLGRIAAQSAKQIIVQKIREAERDKVYSEFEAKKNDILTVSIARFEGPNIICLAGKAEAVLPKSGQVPGESRRVGERLRALVTEIEKRGTRVKIFLSRANDDFVKRLFELEVPEVSDGIVVIKAIAREPGYRTKIAVYSNNAKVDAAGACIGIRGSRIRNVVDELNGENLDIVKWSTEPDKFIKESLKPADVADVIADSNKKRATVYVAKDELSQAIGKGGRNVRLATLLTGWEIDIVEVKGKSEEKNDAPEETTSNTTATEEQKNAINNSGVDASTSSGDISNES